MHKFELLALSLDLDDMLFQIKVEFYDYTEVIFCFGGTGLYVTVLEASRWPLELFFCCLFLLIFSMILVIQIYANVSDHPPRPL